MPKTKESDIIHQRGEYDVRKEPHVYTVYRLAASQTHSVAIQMFEQTPDGRSLAIAYANYQSGLRGKACLDAKPDLV
jgi:hypothetical protein